MLLAANGRARWSEFCDVALAQPSNDESGELVERLRRHVNCALAEAADLGASGSIGLGALRAQDAARLSRILQELEAV